MLVRRSTLLLCRFTGVLSQQHGHPILTLTLPSRNQPVAFTCKPVTGTVGSLITDIVREDGGVTGCDILTEVFFEIKKKIVATNSALEWGETVPSDITVASVTTGAFPTSVQWQNANDPSPTSSLGPGLSTLVAI